MMVKNPSHCTKLEIWAPRYSSAYTATAERVALLAQYKVLQATPIILIAFTKAKHLIGQRYAILRSKAMSFPLDSNGKIPCFAIPMSALEPWESPQDIIDTALSLFD